MAVAYEKLGNFGGRKGKKLYSKGIEMEVIKTWAAKFDGINCHIVYVDETTKMVTKSSGNTIYGPIEYTDT